MPKKILFSFLFTLLLLLLIEVTGFIFFKYNPPAREKKIIRLIGSYVCQDPVLLWKSENFDSLLTAYKNQRKENNEIRILALGDSCTANLYPFSYLEILGNLLRQKYPDKKI